MCGGLRQGRRAAAARTDVRCERMSESANPGEESGRGESVLLSVVVPCYDEEAVVRKTHRRLAAALEGAPGLAFEIVYVNDGSRDSTLDARRELQRADPRVRIVALSRRFGQEVAIAAGVEHAGGDVLAIIDADLQDPPELLLDMLERWRGGADAVHGVRTHREGETAFKRWTARAFYRVINRVSDAAKMRLGFRRRGRRPAYRNLISPYPFSINREDSYKRLAAPVMEDCAAPRRSALRPWRTSARLTRRPAAGKKPRRTRSRGRRGR